MLHLVQEKSARLMKQCYAEWCMDVTSEPLVSTEAQTWCLQEDTTKTAACSFLSHPRSTFSFESVVPISHVFYFLGSTQANLAEPDLVMHMHDGHLTQKAVFGTLGHYDCISVTEA